MKIRFPHPLPSHGTIAVTAPSSPVDTEKLERGIRYLNKLGYRVQVGQSCSDKHYYLAGNDSSRARELMDFICDPQIDAIFCARGGYGSMRILSLLDFQLIRKHAKLLVGFSDITALQWAIWQRSRLVTISGGMVATDMGAESIDSEFESNFWRIVNEGTIDLSLNYQSPAKDHITGHLLPGTLSVGLRLLCSRYFPTSSNLIPVLEDVNEPTHKLEGNLLQLKMASFFQQSPAVIIGHITPSKHEEYEDLPSYREIISHVFKNLEMPVITGLPYGHIPNKISLPVGAPISLYLGSNSHLTTQDSIYGS